jgi:pimeloyl-ACP methyl ester carboxylesterase
MQLKFADVMNYKVRYAESGDKLKHVLLVHGLGGSVESWTYNIDEFAKNFHVFAPDLIGFGHSDKPKIRYAMKTFTNFLSKFMDVIGLKSASVVGSSMGGQIAAEFAITHPSKVEKLVLISPAGIPPKEFKGTKELKQYVKLFEARNLDAVREALLPVDSTRTAITEEYVKNVYRYTMMEGSKHAFMSSLKESSAAPRLANRLKSIKANTLVIWGKDDRLIPVKYCEPFITKMNNCRLVIIEKCGHRPHAEKPDLFNRIVIDFLTDSV